MTLYRAHTTRGRLEVQGADGPVVFTTVPALYDMTNEEANALSRKWGDRVICEVMDDPPETREEDQQITGAKPSGRVLPAEPELEPVVEATDTEPVTEGAPAEESAGESSIEEPAVDVGPEEDPARDPGTESESTEPATEDGDPTAQAEPPAEGDSDLGEGNSGAGEAPADETPKASRSRAKAS